MRVPGPSPHHTPVPRVPGLDTRPRVEVQFPN